MSNEASTSGINMEITQQQQQQQQQGLKQKRRRRQQQQQPREVETKKKIAEISDAIRRKYMNLKLGKMTTKAVTEESSRPIVEPLKRLVENTAALKTSPAISSKPRPTLVKLKQQQQQQQRLKTKKRLSFTPSIAEATIRPETTPLPDSDSYDDDDDDDDNSTVYETTEEQEPDQGETDETIREVLGPKTIATAANTVENLDAYTRNAVGPLSREYLRLFFTDAKKRIDNVYGVYLDDDEQLIIGDSVLTIGENDDYVSVKGKRYAGTRGLYELLFMRLPNEQAYTNADLDAYRHILLATNAHRRGHSASKPTLGNKGHKYRKIVSVLLSSGDRNVGGIAREGSGLPIDDAMTVTDNAIDYVYWDDANELVDRLRLLLASRDAGHTGHDNEIASIVEELREAGLIVN